MLKTIKIYYKQSNAVDKIIVLLILVFLVLLILQVAQVDYSFLRLYPEAKSLLKKPWTLLSYAGVHEHFIPLFTNCLILYYFGQLFLDFFKEKQLILYLLLSVVVGGLVYVLVYSVSAAKATYLSGLTVGITGLMAGMLTKIPSYNINLRFIGAVRIWFIFAIWLLLAGLINLGTNTPAVASLLAGALTGFVLTRFFNEGKGLLRMFDTPAKKTPLKVYKNPNQKTKLSHRSQKNIQDEIDRILDKINKTGYDSLTAEEKQFLFNQSKTNGN